MTRYELWIDHFILKPDADSLLLLGQRMVQMNCSSRVELVSEDSVDRIKECRNYSPFGRERSVIAFLHPDEFISAPLPSDNSNCIVGDYWKWGKSLDDGAFGSSEDVLVC